MTTELTAILSSEEAAERAECEAIIREGRDTFIRVGEALLRAREKKLYRSTHGTFEAYCLDVCEMSYPYAKRLIGASKAIATLKTSPIGEVLPSTEAQARPLTRLKEEEMPEAWSEAVQEAGGKQPTAKQVQAVVERRKQTGLSREPLPLTVTLGRDLGRAARLFVEFYTVTERRIVIDLIAKEISRKGDT